MTTPSVRLGRTQEVGGGGMAYLVTGVMRDSLHALSLFE